MSQLGQTRTSSLGGARPLPPRADIGPGGQSVGQAAQFLATKGRLADWWTAVMRGLLIGVSKLNELWFAPRASQEFDADRKAVRGGSARHHDRGQAGS